MDFFRYLELYNELLLLGTSGAIFGSLSTICLSDCCFLLYFSWIVIRSAASNLCYKVTHECKLLLAQDADEKRGSVAVALVVVVIKSTHGCYALFKPFHALKSFPVNRFINTKK
uniref:Uncharacterized protein n=1 Tax=Glossina pallidipes TaxID=7398 RepID=A0A1B0A326_GLOPL